MTTRPDTDSSLHTNQSYTPATPTELFRQLATIPTDMGMRERYALVARVFRQAADGRIPHDGIRFSGFFAKVDYLLKSSESRLSDKSIPLAINDLRVFIQEIGEIKENDDQDIANRTMAERFERDVAALSAFIGVVYDVAVPDDLRRRYPYKRTAHSRKLLDEGRCLRVIVDSWDQNLIRCTTREGASVTVCYREPDNRFAMGDRSYLAGLLAPGCQLNLVRPRIDNDIIYPELVILSPDNLIDVTSIAACFTEHENSSPFLYLLNRLKPSVSSESIILGNLSGQLLDETLYGTFASIDDSLADFAAHNALTLASSDLTEGFREKALNQRSNIVRALDDTLPQDTGTPYHPDNVILEPSFFCEMLGLQGRMDFLQRDFDMVVEQKSGSGAYRRGADSDVPVQRPSHYVQLLLYMAILHYNYAKDYRSLHAFLMYSKYPQSLLRLGVAPHLLFQALKLRNQIVWLERHVAEGGAAFLATLTPERMLPDEHGYGWDMFVRPGLAAVLDPIREASPLEREYYLRFLSFIQREQILSRTGSQEKEDSGFAAAWNESLAERISAGNIYERLEMTRRSLDADGRIGAVSFRFAPDVDTDVSNFRPGDIVVFYPYANDETPLATQHIVFRGAISRLDDDGVEVTLRNPQTTARVFDYPGCRWAVEHDHVESSYNALFKAMQAFLTAPKERRDLILGQRQPAVDTSVSLRGDYTDAATGRTEFNELVLRAKQAQDFFLIVGPPGTGKTSYGMINVLREQLADGQSSVLLLSFTNRAVDEICDKLEGEGIDYLRLGTELGCAEPFRQHLLSNRVKGLTSVGAIRDAVMSARVFCGTTTAFNAHPELLRMRIFDLAIVDEASQILEPHIIGLLAAQCDGRPSIRKFVLIGDEKQLPAVVQQSAEESAVDNPALRAIGLTDCRQSFFERLIRLYRRNDRNNEYSYMLTRQGRMHADIAFFPSRAFYQNRLAPVPLDHQTAPTQPQPLSSNGIRNILATRRTAFIGYDAAMLPSEGDDETDKSNIMEARMIAAVVFHAWCLTRDTFDPSRTLGIIVPYRNQISTVRNEILRYEREYNAKRLSRVTIDTVERYQGSQRDIIIYGFTVRHAYQLRFIAANQYRDARSGAVVDRKLNVALTRARRRMVIIGCPALLQENNLFDQLIRSLDDEGSLWMVEPSDFVAGNFPVHPLKHRDNAFYVQNAATGDPLFDRFFARSIADVVRSDADTRLPDLVMGNSYATNQELTAYGNSLFDRSMTMRQDLDRGGGESALRTFTPEEQLVLFSFYRLTTLYRAAINQLPSIVSRLIEDGQNTEVTYVGINCYTDVYAFRFNQLMKNRRTPFQIYGMFFSDVAEAQTMELMSMLDGDKNMKTPSENASPSYRPIASFGDIPAPFTDIPAPSSSQESRKKALLLNFAVFQNGRVNARQAEQLAIQTVAFIRRQRVDKTVVVIHQRHSAPSRAVRVFCDIISTADCEVLKSLPN